jgi:alkylmercury lyase-like protein
VFAMCAIDALGVSAMTGVPVEIESANPSTGEPITVNVDGGIPAAGIRPQRSCTSAAPATAAPGRRPRFAAGT